MQATSTRADDDAGKETPVRAFQATAAALPSWTSAIDVPGVGRTTGGFQSLSNPASLLPHPAADVSTLIQQLQQPWMVGNSSTMTPWQAMDSTLDWMHYVYGASNVHQRLLQLRLLQLAHQFNCI